MSESLTYIILYIYIYIYIKLYVNLSKSMINGSNGLVTLQ